MTPPLVAISTYVETARFGFWDEPADLVPHSYVSAVTGRAASRYCSRRPPGPRRRARRGGRGSCSPEDRTCPATYGAEPDDRTDQPRQDRDRWELALCHGALDQGLPLLAICRGLQILNVALGGTLHQHLPDVVGHDDHRPVPGQPSPNPVTLKEGSRAGLPSWGRGQRAAATTTRPWTA